MSLIVNLSMCWVFHRELNVNEVFCETPSCKFLHDSIEIGGVRVPEAGGATMNRGLMMDALPYDDIALPGGD